MDETHEELFHIKWYIDSKKKKEEKCSTRLLTREIQFKLHWDITTYWLEWLKKIMMAPNAGEMWEY